MVILSDTSGIQVDIENRANIENKSEWDLNTGNNEANGNNGDVSIETGDILFASTIDNSGINEGIVDVDCCEDEGGPGPDPTPPNPPDSNNNSNNGSSSGSSSSSGGSGGPTAGEVLPVTGAPSLMFLALINVIMFFMGWYLRLRSGNSPNFAK